MSGPKVSVYSLSGRAREIVFGQIRCEQESIACAAVIQSALPSLLNFSGAFEQQIGNIDLLMKRTSTGTEQIEKLRKLQSTLETEVAELEREFKLHIPHVSAKYTISETAYAEKQAELKRLQNLRKKAETLKSLLDEVRSQDRSNQADIQSSIIRDLENAHSEHDLIENLGFLRRDNEQNKQRIQESILTDIAGVYSFELEEDVSDTSFDDAKCAVHNKLSELLKDRSLPAELLGEVSRAIVSLEAISERQRLKTFDSITVKNLMQKISNHKHAQELKATEYQELAARYEALCSMSGETAKKAHYSEQAVQMLKKEIERLELTLVKQQEQTYISECVDQVMSDMGYDLIGSREVQKKNGKRFKNELFTFNEGTAVNVTYSSEGQISMELGGLAREDRIPTDDETEVLTRDMETFCGEFVEFERRLREKGVIVGKRIALSPPSSEYASIINVNDYDISESTQISEMNAKEKRRKLAEKKALRRDN